MTADRLPGPGVGLLKPWDHERRFRLELTMRNVVVREREVEWILPRDESYWNVIPARARLRVVRAAIATRPFQVPRAPVVRHRIISAGFLAHPEHGGDNVHFPRVTLDCRVRTGRDKNLWFHLEQCLLPQFHCVLGEIRRRRVGGSRLLVPEDFRGASNRQTETGRKKSPHHKRRNLLSDSPLLGKANLPKTVM